MPEVTDTSPLRLGLAAAMAFPDGTMTAAGLRREAKRGNLAVTRIAGKDYTTLADIKEMMEKCRVQPKEHVSGSVPPGVRRDASPMPRPGSSSMPGANTPLASALMAVERLKNRSLTTSPENTNQSGGTVTPIRSRLRT
jgi:hypothetical protein